MNSTASKWRYGFPTYEGKFPFVAAVNAGPIAWRSLVPKLETAVLGCGFGFAFLQPPRYATDTSGSNHQPGVGYFIGEAELTRLPHNAWLTAATYSSIVAYALLEAIPKPSGHDLGTPDLPLNWRVTVQVGGVESADGESRHPVGLVRRFTKMLPTDPAFGWIPSAIASALQ